MPKPAPPKYRTNNWREYNAALSASKSFHPGLCNHAAFLPEQPGVLSMDIIAEIRRRHLVSGESISSITRRLNLSRPTVRKHLHTTSEPVYQR